MGDKPTYLYGSNTRNPVQNSINPYTKKHISDVFSEISNLGIEELSIYLLSILFMMSGFLLFIYGLFMEQLYQFVMSFIFLVPGFMLDNERKSDTVGKWKLW